MEEIVESSQLDEQPGFVLAPATPRKRATVLPSSDSHDMEEVGTSQPTEIEMDPALTPGQSRKKVFGSPTRSNIQRLSLREESQAVPSSQSSEDAISTAVTRDPFRTPQRRYVLPGLTVSSCTTHPIVMLVLEFLGNFLLDVHVIMRWFPRRPRRNVVDNVNERRRHPRGDIIALRHLRNIITSSLHTPTIGHQRHQTNMAG